jgi:hypothetical protein
MLYARKACMRRLHKARTEKVWNDESEIFENKRSEIKAPCMKRAESREGSSLEEREADSSNTDRALSSPVALPSDNALNKSHRKQNSNRILVSGMEWMVHRKCRLDCAHCEHN